MSSGFEWLCLIPPLFIVVWAVITKKTFSALIIGAALSYVLMYQLDFFTPFVDALYAVIMDADTVWVILLTIFIGIFIELVTHSGGVDALTQYILKVATNRRRTLLSTFVLGLCFFIGDVSNIGTIGAAMKKTADKNRVPREALAYILDSTAAPVCILVPVSSWGVFFAGLFMAEKSLEMCIRDSFFPDAFRIQFIYGFFGDLAITGHRGLPNETGRVVRVFTTPLFSAFDHFFSALYLPRTELPLIVFVFRRICDDECFVHVPCYYGDLFVIYTVKYVFVAFIQCPEIDHFI